MSPLIAISQRVAIDPRHGERRDALDQRWVAFLLACGLTPVALPNHTPAVEALFAGLPLSGLLLTGGNSLACYGGDAPERDEAEALALSICRRRALPVLGVCRGMQVIQHAFGVPLHPVAGHVAIRHAVTGAWARPDANSFHEWGASEAGPFQVLAVAGDGTVEAIRHPTESIHGIMWHPERDEPFMEHDLFRRIFVKDTP